MTLSEKSNLLTFVQVGALSLLLTYISLIDIKTHLCPNWPNLVILALAIPNIIINISEQYYFIEDKRKYWNKTIYFPL